MNAIDTLNSLRTERTTINQRLAPLTRAMCDKNARMNELRQQQARAGTDLDMATQHAAQLTGQHLTGDATTEQVKAAEKDRRAAEARHADAQGAAASARTLENELAGMAVAAAPLNLRLQAIANEEAKTQESYMRELGDEAGADYAAAVRVLAGKFAAVAAVNMALARMDGVQPDLLTAAFEHLTVPGFNLDTARAPSGLLLETERARALVPAAFANLKARVLADGLTVPGL